MILMIYKLEDNNKIFISRINGEIQNGKVSCIEKNASGERVSFQIKAKINRKSVQWMQVEHSPLANGHLAKDGGIK